MKSDFALMDLMDIGITGKNLDQFKKVLAKYYSVKVWGGIGYNGTTQLYMTERNINSEVYQEIITTAYLPVHQNLFLLMQDNARPHVSDDTLRFMRNNNISLLEWLPCSPDCNPIQNLWGILVQRMYAQGQKYCTIDTLKRKIQQEWDSLNVEEVRKLINHFPNVWLLLSVHKVVILKIINKLFLY